MRERSVTDHKGLARELGFPKNSAKNADGLGVRQLHLLVAELEVDGQLHQRHRREGRRQRSRSKAVGPSITTKMGLEG
jgi:hypothetical protein